MNMNMSMSMSMSMNMSIITIIMTTEAERLRNVTSAPSSIYRRQPLDINKFELDGVGKQLAEEHNPCERTLLLRGLRKTKSACVPSSEQSGVQKSIKDAGLWFATMPEDQLQGRCAGTSNLRKDWDTVDGDRMIKIVFIGQNL